MAEWSNGRTPDSLSGDVDSTSTSATNCYEYHFMDYCLRF